MKKTLTKIDKPLFIVSIVFLVFGLIMILSASSMESYMRYGSSPYYYFIKQLAFSIVAIIAFFIVIKFPTRNYKSLYNMIMIIIIALLLGLTVYGYVSNNAKSWFNLGFASIQPSELAKIAVIIYMAMYYDNHKNGLDNQWTIIKPLFLIPILFLLVAIQPDAGTACIIALLILFVFYSVPIEKKYRMIINRILYGAVAVVAVVLITTRGAFLTKYQLERFNFFNPCERYKEDSGYQLCNSFIAFKNGSLTGQGIGQSTQKYLYLPEAYTDFIFPIIVEEWGLIIGIVIIFGYVFILYKIRKIAKNANNLHNSLLAYGVFVYIFLHIAINLIGVMGLGPLTGVPLPFLSYGGSYSLSLFIGLGLVQRVEIETKMEKITKNTY